jgi:hypothetical protein
MTTKIDCDRQDQNLQNANTGPCFCRPDADERAKAAADHGDPGVPNENHMQMRVWGLRRIEDGFDTIDEAVLVHEELTSAANELHTLHGLDEATCQVIDKINEAATSLSVALDSAVAAAKTEVYALWHGPAVSEVDAALLADRQRVLPFWFPKGAFDDTGRFTCVQGDETIQVSPSGMWIVSYDKKVNRYGSGLSLLRAITRDEAHSVAVARLAQSLGIMPHRAIRAAS